MNACRGGTSRAQTKDELRTREGQSGDEGRVSRSTRQCLCEAPASAVHTAKVRVRGARLAVTDRDYDDRRRLRRLVGRRRRSCRPCRRRRPRRACRLKPTEIRISSLRKWRPASSPWRRTSPPRAPARRRMTRNQAYRRDQRRSATLTCESHLRRCKSQTSPSCNRRGTDRATKPNSCAHSHMFACS